jgi:hypothetical protein
MRREWQKEDLLDKAKDLRNTSFAEVAIIPDLTLEQRKEEAEMSSEAERRNRELTEEDRAKNLEWMVVGARGERRMVKGTVRGRGAGGAGRGVGGAGRGVGGAGRGAASGPPVRGGGSLGPALLPARPEPEPWGPVLSNRGAASSQRGKPGRRPSTKRTRAERQHREEEADETEEEMEDDRQAPPPPMERN